MDKLLGTKSKGWLRGLDLNQRPLGYEPNELPDCSTPRVYPIAVRTARQLSAHATQQNCCPGHPSAAR